MFHNVEGKGFVDVSEGLGPDFTQMGYQRGSASAISQRRLPDLVVTSLNRKPRILLNSGGMGTTGVARAARPQEQPHAIGARSSSHGQRPDALQPRLHQRGFMSSSDRRRQFGLGKESQSARSKYAGRAARPRS